MIWVVLRFYDHVVWKLVIAVIWKGCNVLQKWRVISSYLFPRMWHSCSCSVLVLCTGRGKEDKFGGNFVNVVHLIHRPTSAKTSRTTMKKTALMSFLPSPGYVQYSQTVSIQRSQSSQDCHYLGSSLDVHENCINFSLIMRAQVQDNLPIHLDHQVFWKLQWLKNIKKPSDDYLKSKCCYRSRVATLLVHYHDQTKHESKAKS